MIHIALTGGIASGKSTVAQIFNDFGVPIIDADEVAREIVKPGSYAYQKILQRFGEAYKLIDGTLNREKLRYLIFNDVVARVWLEKLLHPLILLKMQQQTYWLNNVVTKKTFSYCILVIPLLVEMKLYCNTPWIHRILLVDCAEILQKKRLKHYKKWGNKLISKVLQVQTCRQRRLHIADDIIHNNNDFKSLQFQVQNLHHVYMQTYGKVRF